MLSFNLLETFKNCFYLDAKRLDAVPKQTMRLVYLNTIRIIMLIPNSLQINL